MVEKSDVRTFCGGSSGGRVGGQAAAHPRGVGFGCDVDDWEDERGEDGDDCEEFHCTNEGAFLGREAG